MEGSRSRQLSHVSAVWRGRPYPLGATWDGLGVNFALYSEHAERVELCLFTPDGRRQVERVELRTGRPSVRRTTSMTSST